MADQPTNVGKLKVDDVADRCKPEEIRKPRAPAGSGSAARQRGGLKPNTQASEMDWSYTANPTGMMGPMDPGLIGFALHQGRFPQFAMNQKGGMGSPSAMGHFAMNPQSYQFAGMNPQLWATNQPFVGMASAAMYPQSNLYGYGLPTLGGFYGMDISQYGPMYTAGNPAVGQTVQTGQGHLGATQVPPAKDRRSLNREQKGSRSQNGHHMETSASIPGMSMFRAAQASSQLKETRNVMASAGIARPVNFGDTPESSQQPKVVPTNDSEAKNGTGKKGKQPVADEQDAKETKGKVFTNGWHAFAFLGKEGRAKALEHNRNRIRSEQSIPQWKDETITEVEKDADLWIIRIFYAMVNQKGIKDGDSSRIGIFSPSGGNFLLYEIEVAAVAIFEICLRRCKYGSSAILGSLAYPIRAQGPDSEGNCRTRIENVVKALAINKALCRKVYLDDETMRHFVNAPLGFMQKFDSEAQSVEQRVNDGTTRAGPSQDALRSSGSIPGGDTPRSASGRATLNPTPVAGSTNATNRKSRNLQAPPSDDDKDLDYAPASKRIRRRSSA